MVSTLYYRKFRQIIPNSNLIRRHLSQNNKNNKKPKEVADEILNRSLSEVEKNSKLPEKSLEVAKDIVKEFPEVPTTCCMSGCANCVWIDYAENMSNYFQDGGERAEQEITNRIEDSNLRAFLLHELRMKKLKS